MEKRENNSSKRELEIVNYLEKKANLIRVCALQMINLAGDNAGHPGGTLSAADIIAALYFKVMNIKPDSPFWPNRDRFVLSKGHSVPILYAALAERGFFSKSELSNFRKVGSILQGHPDMKKTPGLDMSTGSLGQGLSNAVGMAIGGKIRNNDFTVYVLLSDGELDEGQIWEAAMTASKYKLHNLIAIVDWNGIQNDGPIDKVMPLGDIVAKWKAFGWQVKEIDGHNMREIYDSLKESKNNFNGPVVILAHTIKGKGVSFMENKVEWHAKKITRKELEIALCDLQWNGGNTCE